LKGGESVTARELFRKYGFFDGRMISHSKSFYHHFHPLDLVLFNASIQVLPGYEDEFWINMCDLNLSKEKKKLRTLSQQIQGHVFVYSEGQQILYAHFYLGKEGYQHAWHPVISWFRSLMVRPLEWYRWRKFLKRR